MSKTALYNLFAQLEDVDTRAEVAILLMEDALSQLVCKYDYDEDAREAVEQWVSRFTEAVESYDIQLKAMKAHYDSA